GTTLAVAQQTARIGLPRAGMRVYDVASPERPKELAFFDTSGPHSRGVHFVWFVDGEYAYLATGAPDFIPTHPNDDQFLMIVDLRDRTAPREVGRWWLPGTRHGDAEPPPPRLKLDGGYRMHSLFTAVERKDRAYIGWIDGGIVILDIADRAKPKLVARRSWYPPEVGYAHTALALLERELLVVAEEAVRDRCADWPKRIWMVDLRDETKPRELTAFPAPSNLDDLCGAGGRFGAHNIHVNRPTPTARELKETGVGTFFNGGVRIYSIADPRRPEEIGFLIPEAPPGNESGTVQINDVYVDERGRIYANDRSTGGLYVMEYTGPVPLR
ncbi:MAG: LVIVD repeat-containing protein, partial [Vicinamibacteria bacterium]